MGGPVDGSKVAVEARDRTLTEWVDHSGALGSKFGPTTPLKRPNTAPLAPLRASQTHTWPTLHHAKTLRLCVWPPRAPPWRREGRRHWGGEVWPVAPAGGLLGGAPRPSAPRAGPPGGRTQSPAPQGPRAQGPWGALHRGVPHGAPGASGHPRLALGLIVAYVCVCAP